jgi:antitoxin YefM
VRIINFSDTRNSLRSVIDQVVEDADVTIICRRDAPNAVVMSLDRYNSLMETVHLLSSPANVAHLARSIAQARAGKAQRRELIGAEVLKGLLRKPAKPVSVEDMKAAIMKQGSKGS